MPNPTPSWAHVDPTRALTFNGIDARTGSYRFAPLTTAALAELVAGGSPMGSGDGAAQHLAELQDRHVRATAEHLGVRAGIDATRLDEAGWGVIFPAVEAGEAAREQAAICEALAPLLALRRAQASARHEHYFKQYLGPDGYKPGESKQQFLARHGAAPGPADPDNVPYYLLIVGSPEQIPYHVQYQLDVQYAVGRIHFSTIEEYANYARTVVEAETGGVRRPRELAVIGVANPGDAATTLSRAHLVAPLVERLAAREFARDWTISRYFDERADKAHVSRLYGGPETPALIFSASHGMAFAKDDPLQERHQGALLLQDWPGPEAGHGQIGEDLYFSGDDLRGDAGLTGLISFNFACYGGGTPQYDELARQARKRLEPIAARPFVATLQRKLLGHPRGGALATISHVERAWGYSFMWGTGAGGAAEPQLAVFESTLEALMRGQPVGLALEYFNARYAELATDLAVQLEALDFDPGAVDAATLAAMWTASADARSFAVVGDPAVRLTFEDSPQPDASAAVELASFAAAPEPEPEPSEPVPIAAPTSPSRDEDLRARLLARLDAAVDALAGVEVRTYVSDEVASAAAGSVRDADLYAHTRIGEDGSAALIVARADAAVDPSLLARHLELVDQTRRSQIATIEALARAIAALRDPSS